MKNCAGWLIAVLLLPLSAGAEVRTFTNKEGRKVEAELVAVVDTTAVLRLANGKEAKVPLASLSEEDQTYAKAWHEENKDKVNSRDLKLEIEKESKRLKEGEAGGGRGNRVPAGADVTDVTFKCELENLSNKKIEGLTANYTIHKRLSTRGSGGSDTSLEETSDSTEVPVLEPGKAVEFELGPERCVDYTKKSNKGPSESQREKILGVVITLMSGETEILKASEPSNFIDRLEEEAAREEARNRGRE
jgi:hypothetical protein